MLLLPGAAAVVVVVAAAVGDGPYERSRSIDASGPLFDAEQKLIYTSVNLN